MEFRPSPAASVLESLIVGGVLAVLVPVGLYFLRGVSSVPYLASFGLTTGAVVAAFYVLRFLWRAPRLIRIDAEGLSIHRRSSKISVAWSEVTDARHDSSFGLRWRMRTALGDVVVRDDGLTTSEWEAMSALIRRHLTGQGVRFKQKGIAKIFND